MLEISDIDDAGEEFTNSCEHWNHVLLMEHYDSIDENSADNVQDAMKH